MFCDWAGNCIVPPYNITVLKSGLGTVTSDPAGINCGPTCSYSSIYDMTRLTATPASGYHFLVWHPEGSVGCWPNTELTCMASPLGSAGLKITARFVPDFTGPVCCNGECYKGSYNAGTSYSFVQKMNDWGGYAYYEGGILATVGAPGDIATIKFCGGDAYWEHTGGEIWCEYGGLARKGIYKSPRNSTYYYYLGTGNISTLKCCADNSGEWESNNNYYKSICGSKVVNSDSQTRTCSGATGCTDAMCTLSGDAPEGSFNPGPYCITCSPAGLKECATANSYRICDSSLHWGSAISCPAGQTCINGECGCTPETDTAFCTRLGKTCGSVTANDNCGSSRTVSSCGTCASNQICSDGNCIAFISPSYWADLVGLSNRINSTGFEDTVALVVPGEGLENKYINYSILKDRYFWWDKKIAQTSSLGYSLWQANLSANDIYFLSLVEGDTAEKQSNMLQVAAQGPPYSVNSLPVANITSPEDNFKASTYCFLNFTQASYDEDDLLRLTWNFGDNITNSMENYSLAISPLSGDIYHSYNSSGVYSVSLTASEMTRNQTSTDSVNVYIFKEGLNVMPVITLPENGAGYGLWVDFNASQSYVANCSLNMPGYNFTACNLQCKYIHAPGTRNITGNYDLRMNWTVRDEFGKIEPLNLPSSGSWKNNYYGIVEFDNYFMNPGRHNAVLDMEYLPNS
jgi:hypothetical protein